jgi:hypothetical protein
MAIATVQQLALNRIESITKPAGQSHHDGNDVELSFIFTRRGTLEHPRHDMQTFVVKKKLRCGNDIAETITELKALADEVQTEVEAEQ